MADWVLSKVWEKAVFVLGCIYLVLLVIGFIVGFVGGYYGLI
jgi:uncharacterized membrane protein YGL010W